MSYSRIPLEKGQLRQSALQPNSGMLYLSYTVSNFVLVVNTISKSIVGKIKIKHPGNMAINPSTNMLYVSSTEGIYVIDTLTNKAINVIKVGKRRLYGDVAINPLTNTIYSTNFDGNFLTVIDATTGLASAKIKVGKDTVGIAVDQEENKIYVANRESKTISIVDGNQPHKLINTLKFIKNPHFSYMYPNFVLLNKPSNLLYVRTVFACGYMVHPYYDLHVIDITEEKVISKLNLHGLWPDGEGLMYNNCNNSFYMTSPDFSCILKFDEYAKKLLATLKPNIPFHIHEYKSGILGRIYKPIREIFTLPYPQYGKVVAVNPLTNRLYFLGEPYFLYEIES